MTVEEGATFLLGCPGSSFLHTPGDLLLGRCTAGEWQLEGEAGRSLANFGCQHQPAHTTNITGRCGPAGEGTEIQIQVHIKFLKFCPSTIFILKNFSTVSLLYL